MVEVKPQKKENKRVKQMQRSFHKNKDTRHFEARNISGLKTTLDVAKPSTKPKIRKNTFCSSVALSRETPSSSGHCVRTAHHRLQLETFPEVSSALFPPLILEEDLFPLHSSPEPAGIVLLGQIRTQDPTEGQRLLLRPLSKLQLLHSCPSL